MLLVGTALAKLHPRASRQRLILRLGWLVVVAGGVLLSFVVIESLYFLRMPAFDPFLLALAVLVHLSRSQLAQVLVAQVLVAQVY